MGTLMFFFPDRCEICMYITGGDQVGSADMTRTWPSPNDPFIALIMREYLYLYDGE